MKYSAIILICLLSVSCLTTNRIQKNCDKFELICVTDKETITETETIYKDTIIYRDTVIYKTLPGKIIERKTPVIIRGKVVNSELSVLKAPFAISYAEIRNSILKHKLIQVDTILRIKLEGALKESKHWKSEYIKETNKETITIKENTDWASLCIKIVWGLLVVVVLGIGFLILKFKSNILGLVKRIL